MKKLIFILFLAFIKNANAYYYRHHHYNGFDPYKADAIYGPVPRDLGPRYQPRPYCDINDPDAHCEYWDEMNYHNTYR
jgi:hypothetical protein